MAKLILRGEDGTEKEFPLEQSGSLTIGRSPECEIPISDGQASRRHCSVVRLSSGWELADLGSTNGTLLNSVLVKRKKLRHGDVIRIGSTEISMHDPDSAGSGGGELSNCFLVYAKGEQKGEKIELDRQRTTMGRKDTNTLVLADSNASSYHCEIVRGLNGYTIRDLGSTNGTLVNSEMITEAQLAHGARIRVGSTRFVFQDPAMAEIDLDLAGVDDDESDWGMMRELDLAAVRKRNPVTLVYAVIFAGILGGLGYLTTLEPAKAGGSGPVAPKGSLIETYSFEKAASAFLWESEQPGAVTTRTSPKIHGEGKSGLEVRCQSDRADVFYADSFPASGRRYLLEGKLAASGCSAQLGLLWTGLGLSRWDAGATVAAGGLRGVEVAASAPPWAGRVRIAIHIEGQGIAVLDDVSLILAKSGSAVRIEQNNFTLSVVDATAADMFHTGAPILVNGRLFALDAAGRPVAGAQPRLAAEVQDPEHILVTIRGDAEAARLGIEWSEVRGYLSRGGFRGFGQKGDSGETYFARSFPSEGSRIYERVRKLLLGNPGRAFAVLPAEGAGRLTSVARVEGKQRFWSLAGPATDGEFHFRLKTDLHGETAVATRRMGHALTLYREGRWGEFQVEAERALAEFPFANKSTQRQLNERIAELNKQYGLLSKRAQAMLADYDEFRDRESLDRVREVLQVWRDKYQIRPGETARGKEYSDVAAKEATRRSEAERKRQSKLAKSVLEQALYLHIPEGEIYSAAVMLTYVTEWLPASPQAQQARAELAKIEKDRKQVAQVFRALGLRGTG